MRRGGKYLRAVERMANTGRATSEEGRAVARGIQDWRKRVQGSG